MTAVGHVAVSRRWRRLTWGLMLALALHVLHGFDEHTLSNDEPVQHSYGQLLLDFHASGFTDLRAFDYVNLHLYGGLFDLVAALLEPVPPLSAWDLRHLLTGLIGLAGCWAAALVARQLGGDRAAALTLAGLALTGAWSGALFTHTKDIPFATAMTWALFFNTRLMKELATVPWPRPRWSTALGWGAATGCALGLRVGGLFAIGYIGLGLLVLAWQQGPSLRDLLLGLRRLWPAAGAALLLALLLMAVAWPWAVSGPDHLWQAATRFSHFSFGLRTVFNGEALWIADVPRSYLPHYLAVRLPELVLAGLLAGAALWLAGLAHRRRLPSVAPAWWPLGIACAFPLLLAVSTRPALYNGLRHFTFLLPPLVILAALGWDRLWNWAASTRGPATLVVAAAALLLALPAAWRLAALHPYEYVAYNVIAGGARGAQDRYEMDYWSDGLREAAGLLNDLAAREPPPAGRHYRVAVCAEPLQLVTYLDPRLRGTRDWSKADFFVASTTENCDSAVPGPVSMRIVRAGATLMVVKDLRAIRARGTR